MYDIGRGIFRPYRMEWASSAEVARRLFA
jgi:hypothetical protein